MAASYREGASIIRYKSLARRGSRQRLGLGLYFANCLAFEIWGVFRGKNRAKFISFWAPEKNHAKCGFTAKNFSRGVEIFFRGVGHVPLAVPVLLHGHPFRALIHITSLYGSHFTIYHTQLYVHSRKYWILVSKCRKILRNFAKCVLSYAKCANFFLYKTKLIT
jgi:hypothetical protein